MYGFNSPASPQGFQLPGTRRTTLQVHFPGEIISWKEARQTFRCRNALAHHGRLHAIPIGPNTCFKCKKKLYKSTESSHVKHNTMCVGWSGTHVVLLIYAHAQQCMRQVVSGVVRFHISHTLKPMQECKNL